MGVTRQLVYVKKKKHGGSSSSKSRMPPVAPPTKSANSTNSTKSAAPSLEPDSAQTPITRVRRKAEKAPNWYLRIAISTTVIGMVALIFIKGDLGAKAWNSLKSMPSPYTATSNWHGQDARLSGLDRKAAKKRPGPTEESFITTFRGRGGGAR